MTYAGTEAWGVCLMYEDRGTGYLPCVWEQKYTKAALCGDRSLGCLFHMWGQSCREPVMCVETEM